ncbi:MAG: ABC transporter ATP-binding protein [Tissierellia bacterium]|nr:ABC transporter ATP-binding protein [Tissierellia bacterium]
MRWIFQIWLGKDVWKNSSDESSCDQSHPMTMKRFRYFLAVLFSLIHAFSLSRMGLRMGNLVDTIVSGELQQFHKSIRIIAVFILISFLLSLLAWRIVFGLLMDRMVRFKSGLFKSDLEKQREEGVNLADYATNMELIYQKKELLGWNMLNLIATFLFACSTIYQIDIYLLPIALAASILPVISTLVTGRCIRLRSTEFKNTNSRFIKFANEYLEGRQEIQRYGVKEKSLQEIELVDLALEQSRAKLRGLVNTANITSGTFGAISFLLIFSFGGKLAQRGAITIGAVIAVVQLMNYLVDPIIGIIGLINEYNSVIPIYRNLKDKIAEGNKDNDQGFEGFDAQLNEPDIRVENIYFSYSKDQNPILENFSYRFEYGKKYLLIGESGRGKTTLMRLINGELMPNRGQIRIGEIDIMEFPEAERVRYIQIVDQNPMLFSGGVEWNLRFFREIQESEIETVMKNLGIDQIPPDRLTNSTTGLSQGQRLRVLVGRALLEPKPIMIFDEPIASLDEQMGEAVLDRILALDGLIIVIAHNAGRLQNRFDHIIEL